MLPVLAGKLGFVHFDDLNYSCADVYVESLPGFWSDKFLCTVFGFYLGCEFIHVVGEEKVALLSCKG